MAQSAVRELLRSIFRRPFGESATSESLQPSAIVALTLSTHDPNFIDVKKLIEVYDVAEHARRADEYFKEFSLDRTEFRKPFMGFETVHLVTNLGIVLGNLGFYPGMRVLDFGCGTGWLSQSLALMGCRPIAVDVSKRALELGKTFTAAKYPEIANQITYLPFDGLTLDVPDCSVDRVVCMDSFHHVANQDQILREIHRVLTVDGRAVFCEPGDQHSLAPESQYQMRTFGVIENDIVIDDVWQMARTIGFKDIKLSAFSLQPTLLSLAELASLQSLETATGVLKRAYDEVYKPLYTGARLFVLYKDRETPDSRSRDGLAGVVAAQVEDEGDDYRIFGTITNTGSTTWRASGGELGAVNLGFVLRHRDGTWDWNIGRAAFLDTALSSGGVRKFETRLSKNRIGDAELHADLVAEFVTWFSQLSGTLVRLV